MSSIGHENGLSVEEIRAIQQRVGRPHDVDHNQENPQTVLADATLDALLLRRMWDAVGAEGESQNSTDYRTALRWFAVALFALGGMLIAVYLSLYHLGIIREVVCGEGADCAAVQDSPFFRIAGIPIPYIAVFAYGTILTLALLATRPRYEHNSTLTHALFAFGVLALGFALYNTATERFRIHAYCPWCLACAACGAMVFLLTLPQRQTVPPARGARQALKRRFLTKLATSDYRRHHARIPS